MLSRWRTSEMATPSRYLEAPRRLRAFVRAHETSLVVLAAMIGTIGGLVVLAMSVAVAALHALLFNISITERLSSQPSIETLRAVLVPSLGGLLLGVALLLLLRWRPAREIDPIEANALHGGRMSFRGSVIVALQTTWSSGVGASVGLEAGYTQLASGLAASLGRGFHLRRADQRIMVGCGAAAAISGAFGAPLAGAFYAFELVIGGYTPASLAPVGVAAVAGYFVTHGFEALSLGISVGPVGDVVGRDLADCRAARGSGGAVRHPHHARRGLVRDGACEDRSLAAAAPGARRPRGRSARAADAAGDVVGSWRAAFFRPRLDAVADHRRRLRSEGAGLDCLARLRLPRRIVLRHAVHGRARRPPVRRRRRSGLAGSRPRSECLCGDRHERAVGVGDRRSLDDVVHRAGIDRQSLADHGGAGRGHHLDHDHAGTVRLLLCHLAISPARRDHPQRRRCRLDPGSHGRPPDAAGHDDGAC